MFNIISISELQKAPARTFKNTKGYSFVLSNNKKVGLVISEEMTKALEESGALEKFEDILLSSGNKFLEEKKEAEEIIKTGDYSNCINFDELCKLA